MNPFQDAKISFDPNQTQEEFEIEFFGLILEQNSQNVDVIRRQAELMGVTGQHHKALELDRTLVALRPLDAVAHYNMSCSLAQLGEVAEAVATLRKAIELGYQDFAQIEIDSDLDTIREHPGFLSLMESLGWI